ncbi:hypothetical protein R6Q57_025433 [Mikania cordata]
MYRCCGDRNRRSELRFFANHCSERRDGEIRDLDSAGQERYHSLAPMCYKGATAAIIVYDITTEVIQTWSWHLLGTKLIWKRGGK